MPVVGVLNLLCKPVTFSFKSLHLDATQRDFPDVIDPGIERWIDVEQVHLATKPICKQVREHFFVVSVEQETAVVACIALWTKGLDVLGRKGRDVAQGMFTNP